MARRGAVKKPGPRSLSSAEERLKIARGALYFAPKYLKKKGGEWALKSELKFAEVKRLLESERSAASLCYLFGTWLKKNEAKWEEMKVAALADWDVYFAEEIAREAEFNRADSRAEEGGGERGWTRPDGIKDEANSFNADSGEKKTGSGRSEAPVHHNHGPIFNGTVKIYLKMEPGDAAVLLAQFRPNQTD